MKGFKMKTIKEEWEEFSNLIKPGEEDKELVLYDHYLKSMKMAFYSGASVGLLKWSEIAKLDSKVKDVVLVKILNECQEFCEQITKKV